MKRTDHTAFGRFIAEWECRQELQRIGRPWDPLYIIVVNWVGDHVATLPDDLEPGIDAYHRKIFHNKDAFRKIEDWKKSIRDKDSYSNQNWWLNIFLLMCLSAYQSHIYLDSTTTMRVPDYQWIVHHLKAFSKSLYVEVSPRLVCIALHVLLICLRSGFALTGVRTCLYSRFSRTMVTSSLVRDVPQSIGRTRSAVFSRG